MRAVPCRPVLSVGPVFRRSRTVWRRRMLGPRRGPLPSLARIRTPVRRPGTRILQRRLQNQICNRLRGLLLSRRCHPDGEDAARNEKYCG